MKADTRQLMVHETVQKILDRGKAHPAQPFIFFIPLIVAQLVFASFELTEAPNGAAAVAQAFGLFVLGAFVWTFMEYILHRFTFHPTEGLVSSRLPFVGWFARQTSVVHLSHHDAPQEPKLIVAPLLLSAPMYVLFAVGFYMVTGSVIATAFFGSGMIGMYLLYEYVHYSVHCFRPRTALGRYWKKYHMVHHFADPDAYYGVTTPIWDKVFGTYPGPLRTGSRKSPKAASRSGAPASESGEPRDSRREA